jgi:hypothetical protein
MATPAVDRRAVAADLRQDWPAALRQVGFDTDLATAWVAEGLLHYLVPYAKHRLLDDVTALSTEDSGLALEPPVLPDRTGPRIRFVARVFPEPGGCPRPAGRRLVLPGATGLTVQRPRRAELSLSHGARKARTHGEDVRKRRTVRPTQ